MSYGLSVYLSRQFTEEELHAVAADIRDLSVKGVDMPAGRYYELQRALKRGPSDIGSFTGPVRAEGEDLPDEVRTAAPGAEWLYEFDAPLSPVKNLRLVQRFAEGMAKRASGAVYDPQEDAVTWPARTGPAAPADPGVEIDTVEFEWNIRRTAIPSDLAGLVFDAIESNLPEALPRRFGVARPYPWSLKKDGRSGFVRAWDTEEMGLCWEATPPSFGGQIFDLGPKWSLSPVEGAIGSLTMSFDARLGEDEGQLRRAVDLFRALTERSEAFFGAARVTRRVLLQGGRRWHRGSTVRPHGLFGGADGREWLGLPSEPCWLVWLPPPYRSLVEEGIRRLGPVEEVRGGFLLRIDDALRSPAEPPAPAAAPHPAPSLWNRLLGRRPRETVRAQRAVRGLADEFPALVVRVDSSVQDETAWDSRKLSRADIVPAGI